jgi:hypothetical protein
MVEYLVTGGVIAVLALTFLYVVIGPIAVLLDVLFDWIP